MQKGKAALVVLGGLLVAAFVFAVAQISQANNAGNTGANTYLAQTTVETGDTIANTTTPNMLNSVCRIAANQLSVGKTIMCVFGGIVSDTATPNLTVDVRANPTPGAGATGTVLWSSGATALGSGIANLTWEARVYITCVTAGASGAVNIIGAANLGNTTALAPIVGATAVTGTITFDTTAATTVGAGITWSAASASNTITQRYTFPWLGN